jgi:hypothetical protein
MREISVPGEMSRPRGIETDVLHGSILSFILQSVGKRFPPFPVTNKALFVGDACVYTTDVLRKIPWGLLYPRELEAGSCAERAELQ